MNNAKRQRQNETRRQNLISNGWREVRTGLWTSTTTGGKHPAGVDGYVWAKRGLRGTPFAAAHIKGDQVVPVNTILSAEELKICINL